ncbi:MAG TPA: c-type cytochrome [Xanthobacteraceae bacterium]|nr:c-type cytochrome [Xanthobacteraceae bacterium]
MLHAAAESVRRPAVVAVCTPCHGVDGRGVNVEIPNLAGQPGIYLREQLLAFRSGTRRHPQMKGLARSLNDREINALVGYFSILPPP